MSPKVGFSMRIQLEWLEQTAILASAGKQSSEIKSYLNDMLTNQLSGTSETRRGNRQKAVTILMRTWVNVPEHFIPLRNQGLSLLQTLPANNHIAIHWAMLMVAYPFFGTVAEITGRYLRLQESISTSQVQRRIREVMGERETVSRATRRTLRCFVDWKVLKDTEDKGILQPTTKINLVDISLRAWVLECCLVSSGASSGILRTISDTPALFPFDIQQLNAQSLQPNSRLDVLKQGLDEDIITLSYKI